MHRPDVPRPGAADDALTNTWGPDGTQPVGGEDALRVSGVSDDRFDSRDVDATQSGADPLPLPRLPDVPAVGGVTTQGGAVERWMARDADEHRDDPPPASYRVLPTRPEPPSPPRPRTPAGIDPPESARAARHEPRGDEEPWVRERREEQEFLREFGQWRAGSGMPGAGPPRMRRSTLVSPPVLLLGLILFAVLYYLVVA